MVTTAASASSFSLAEINVLLFRRARYSQRNGEAKLASPAGVPLGAARLEKGMDFFTCVHLSKLPLSAAYLVMCFEILFYIKTSAVGHI